MPLATANKVDVSRIGALGVTVPAQVADCKGWLH